MIVASTKNSGILAKIGLVKKTQNQIDAERSSDASSSEMVPSMAQNTAPAAPQSPDAWAEGVETGHGDLVGRLGRIALLSLVIFTGWAVIFPLDSAVVAPGNLIMQGQNKVLQHRMGGTVRAIHARDGDRVKEGQLLFELDPALNQAELTKLRGRREVLRALKTRLEAEKAFSERLAKSGTRINTLGSRLDNWKNNAPGTTLAGAQFMSEQEREFEKGRNALMAEVESLENRTENYRRQQAGARARTEQVRRQVAILEEQYLAADQLAKGGHLSRQQVWDIQTRLLDRRSELASLTSQDNALTSQIDETQSQIRQTISRDSRLTSEKLTDVLGELEQTSDQLRAAESELANSEIRASVTGTLVHVQMSTVGGVVRPGETFAELVPEGSIFEANARVAPRDIGNVKLGQSVKMNISALNQRIFDKVEGAVSYVAADATVDQRTGERYFEVKARLDQTALAKLPPLSAGMSGEVYIRSAPRTFATYMLEPVIDSMNAAFSEKH